MKITITWPIGLATALLLGVTDQAVWAAEQAAEPQTSFVAVEARILTRWVKAGEKMTPVIREAARELGHDDPEWDVISSPKVTTLAGTTAILRIQDEKTGSGSVIEVLPTIAGKAIVMKGTASVLRGSGKVASDVPNAKADWRDGLVVDYRVEVDGSGTFVAFCELPQYGEGGSPRKVEIQIRAMEVDSAGRPIH